MAYLRLVRSAPLEPELETSCIGVYERELDYLFETLHRLGASPRETEDLAHEVFLVLHRNWPQLDLTRPFRPYLFAVAFRVVCAHRRRRGREVPYAYLEIEDPTVDPEESLRSHESNRLLMAALDAVPLARRGVVVMHDLDGCSVVEIAAQLSLTRFGVYARLRKGRKELASALRRLLRAGLRR
ncbi:MAG TPA: sigma-70 family RNA polymerase sigma factor [Polyangia bacterium]|nr:sigma-70 family RNA polymerase sigma factor [Polyangia bacterium]